MNDVVARPVDLRDRTMEFSGQIIRLVRSLQGDLVARPLLDQLVRSATSVGANFVEAKNASSKKDFRNKVFIAKKEASETLYWLQLLEEFASSQKLQPLQQECREIVLILQKIINTLDH